MYLFNIHLISWNRGILPIFVNDFLLKQLLKSWLTITSRFNFTLAFIGHKNLMSYNPPQHKLLINVISCVVIVSNHFYIKLLMRSKSIIGITEHHIYILYWCWSRSIKWQISPCILQNWEENNNNKAIRCIYEKDCCP